MCGHSGPWTVHPNAQNAIGKVRPLTTGIIMPMKEGVLRPQTLNIWGRWNWTRDGSKKERERYCHLLKSYQKISTQKTRVKTSSLCQGMERNRIIYETLNLCCPVVQVLSIHCQLQIINRYRIFHLITKKGILFSSACGTCLKINILCHKTSLSIHKRI